MSTVLPARIILSQTRIVHLALVGLKEMETCSFAVTFMPVVAGAPDYKVTVLWGLDPSRIIPATGFSAGLRYDASFWGATWSVTGRYGQLIISEKMASVMTFGGGVLMRF